MQKIRQDISIGHNIRKIRLAAHMTQEQVVAKLQIAGCEVSRSMYSQMEAGTYNIRVSELSALCTLFGRDYNAFFDGI